MPADGSVPRLGKYHDWVSYLQALEETRDLSDDAGGV